jgi:hypothetical protein
MKRLVYAAVVALLGTAALAVAAVAAPAPGTYKGNLYAGAKKGAPGTVTVAGKKVTIKVAKLPIKCQVHRASNPPQHGPFTVRLPPRSLSVAGSSQPRVPRAGWTVNGPAEEVSKPGEPG